MLPSFEEKSVWVQLIGLVVVFAGYFGISGVMLANGVTEMAPYVSLFVVAIVLLVIVQIVGHIAAAVIGKPEPRDERDRLIGWRAESNSSWLLATGVFAAIMGLLFEFEPVWISHVLLASLFASEALKLVLQIVYYRRGV